MALQRSRPSATLAAELTEVAEAATELFTHIERGVNLPLPPEFPRDQLLSICRGLTDLPNGTGEGCRAILEYSRSRLPGIRREYIAIGRLSDQSPDLLTRGTTLDQKLASLISAVTTAWDAYCRLSGEEADEQPDGDSGIAPSLSDAAEAEAQATQLNEAVISARNTASAVLTQESPHGENLQRQLQDVASINRVASAEVKMPRVMPPWLRKVTNALKECPAVIRTTAEKVKVGVDVAEALAERWHEFSHDGLKFVFIQIRKTTKMFTEVAEILEHAKHSTPIKKNNSEDPDAIFAPLSSPVKCITALEEVMNHGPRNRSDLVSIVGRNEVRDLLSLGLLVQTGETVRLKSDIPADAETILRRSFALTKTMAAARKKLLEDPQCRPAEMAAAIMAEFGMPWTSPASLRRYGGTIRFWAVWLEPHLLDIGKGAASAALVTSVRSGEVRRGGLKKMTPEIRAAIRRDLMAIEEGTDTLKYTLQEIAVRHGISMTAINNDAEFNAFRTRVMKRTRRGIQGTKLR